jgi:hypothetical protein
MYGVPEDLPLKRFIGVELNQIALGQFQIQFHFAGVGSISVESKWELRDQEGKLIDQEIDHASRECYCIHRIIDQEVVSYDINPPSSFTLHFKNGFSLIVYDDSEQYESVSIRPDGIYI